MSSERFFEVNRYGWLEYQPIKEFRLPHLDFLNEKERERDSSMATFRLYWPGELWTGDARQDDSIPGEIAAQWPSMRGAVDPNGRVSIRTLIERGLPEEVPVELAYHLAVNHREYKVDRPVAGLPGAFARFVVEKSRFLLDARYRSAAVYLKHLAETHHGHPMFVDFDTAVREKFSRISEEAIRLFFFALGDRLEDRDAGFFWAPLATYFFWVGRTGMGLYSGLSKLDESDGYEDETLRMTDLTARLRAWNSTGDGSPMARARAYSRALRPD